jgi:hypothetical protein
MGSAITVQRDPNRPGPCLEQDGRDLREHSDWAWLTWHQRDMAQDVGFWKLRVISKRRLPTTAVYQDEIGTTYASCYEI